MKIEFDKGDLDYIEKVNGSIKSGTNDIPLLINEGNTYYINFTCKDRGIKGLTKIFHWTIGYFISIDNKVDCYPPYYFFDTLR